MAVRRKLYASSTYKVAKLPELMSELLRKFMSLTCLVLLISSFLSISPTPKALAASSSTAKALTDLENPGLQGGWAIDNNGNVRFPHSLDNQLSLIEEADATWVRINFRLGGCYKDWVTIGCNGSTALQTYDMLIHDALSRGLKILGLLSNEAWQGGQGSWTANNAENSSGNGDNPYLQAFSLNAAVVLAKHYSAMITTWEVWNGPNAWTAHPSPTVYTGGSYMYPSNFAWLLRHVYEDTRNAGVEDVTFVSGGVFSHDIGGSFSSGADYITATYTQGKSHADWNSIKERLESYPLDAIGEQLYIDQGGETSSAKISSYLEAIRKAFMAFEGPSTEKKIVITEFGWNTASMSQVIQAENLKIAYATFASTSYVKNAYWFSIQDIPEANPRLYFGLQTGGSASANYRGVHKLSFSTYEEQER